MARVSAPPLVLSRSLPVGESLRSSAAKTTTVPLLGRRGAAKLIFMKLILEPDEREPGGYAAIGLRSQLPRQSGATDTTRDQRPGTAGG